MTLATLEFVLGLIDLWSNRPAGEFSWEFSRRLCLCLMRLDPSSVNAVSFQFSLSIPHACMLIEFLRADYPNPAPTAPAAPPQCSGDRRVLITEEDMASSTGSIAPAPMYPAEQAVNRLLPDLPRWQLTTAIANEYHGGTSNRSVPCVICTDDIGLRTYMTQLTCGHIFHTHCIAHVFDYRDYKGQTRPCPCCRFKCGPVPDSATSREARMRVRVERLEYLGEEERPARKIARRR